MHQTFGYARVSTIDQNQDTQLDILTKAGCDRILQDKSRA
ncbi:recombinase family protein [Hymenobacter sublimis]